jgi:hypothetical protein
MNFFTFYIIVDHFALLDPDPSDQSHADPDPKHWRDLPVSRGGGAKCEFYKCEILSSIFFYFSKEVFQLVNKSEEEEADVVDADFRNTGQTNHSLVILVSVEYLTRSAE